MLSERLTRTLLVLFVASAIGCSDDDPTSPVPDTEFEYGPTLSSFAQNVVVPTYAKLATEAAALNSAVDMVVENPDQQARFDQAAAAWVATREPWEASEAFLFGPASFLSLDPSLDSWPVDRNQLDNVLASEFDLTPEFIAEGLGSALRGFHTIEFLLFRDGRPREIGSVTERELEYLVASTQVLADDAALLHGEWENGFADEFANAGSNGSRYATQGDAVLELVEGMIGICDEVANGKIADPFDQGDSELVESQFSWNSLTDFQNNIRSVQNAYLGKSQFGTDGLGIDEYVASRDSALDARLQSEISAAISAVAAIPEPFRNNLDKAALIEMAQEAVMQILNTLEGDVKPLLND